jgi:3-hydroxyacyl-CoA dehydrogenase
MSTNKPIRRVAIIGTGVIGASWTALFLAKGLDVIATDFHRTPSRRSDAS